MVTTIAWNRTTHFKCIYIYRCGCDVIPESSAFAPFRKLEKRYLKSSTKCDREFSFFTYGQSAKIFFQLNWLRKILKDNRDEALRISSSTLLNEKRERFELVLFMMPNLAFQIPCRIRLESISHLVQVLHSHKTRNCPLDRRNKIKRKKFQYFTT